MQCVKTWGELKGDVLLITPHYIKELDALLGGIMSLNDRDEEWVEVTTNGTFHIPRIVICRDPKRIIHVKAEQLAICGLELLKWAPDKVITTLNSFEEKTIAEGVQLARRLTEAPSNLMTPTLFAKECEKLDLHVEVLPPTPAMEAVGKGSSNPSKLVIMHYKGCKGPPLALVGKGVCFDAGGLALKHNFLLQMKQDKAGAAAVVGLMYVLSILKPKQHVVAILPLVENITDGNALRHGDVITMLSGKKVEVKDPDAEGRLILADGITYAQKHFAPQTVIDLGTLTLETLGALADQYAGLFCNAPPLQDSLIKVGEEVGERVWPLPLGLAFRKQLFSKTADLSNDGIGKFGASSVAAEFLCEFVDKGVKWAHLDISGVAWNIFFPEEGVSGFGVHLLYKFILKGEC